MVEKGLGTAFAKASAVERGKLLRKVSYQKTDSEFYQSFNICRERQRDVAEVAPGAGEGVKFFDRKRGYGCRKTFLTVSKPGWQSG